MFQFTAFCLKWSRTCRGARMHCTFHSKLHSIEASRNEWNITPNVHNRLTNRAERAHLKHSFHHVCSSVFVQLNRLECVTERQCIMRWLAGRNAVHQWTTINYFGYFSSSHSIHIMMFFFGGGGFASEWAAIWLCISDELDAQQPDRCTYIIYWSTSLLLFSQMFILTARLRASPLTNSHHTQPVFYFKKTKTNSDSLVTTNINKYVSKEVHQERGTRRTRVARAVFWKHRNPRGAHAPPD